MAEALGFLRHLSSDERDAFLQSTLKIFVSYAVTRDQALLDMLDADIKDLARLRSRPGFEKVLAAARDERPDLPAYATRA
jgi:hypothetical protein